MTSSISETDFVNPQHQAIAIKYVYSYLGHNFKKFTSLLAKDGFRGTLRRNGTTLESSHGQEFSRDEYIKFFKESFFSITSKCTDVTTKVFTNSNGPVVEVTSTQLAIKPDRKVVGEVKDTISFKIINEDGKLRVVEVVHNFYPTILSEELLQS